MEPEREREREREGGEVTIKLLTASIARADIEVILGTELNSYLKLA